MMDTLDIKFNGTDIPAPDRTTICSSDGSGEPLPEFDPTIEREAESSDCLSRQIDAGEIEITRKDVSIDEVIAKIDAYTQED